ncbi:hypothetical protein M9H77_26082 [Catharanthus roseus]|uniref:Uncharacterized protein n=1 Tax=Catharanthus roseus TaxID=4058 RepID=A0ACC0A9J2_CATRO|nr:hypothetical protein M9H77_26082 [Catharanthus roseus]
MAESQKGTTSSVNSKGKDSLLDLDFGKDFLTSWKSMSMTEDPMDLDFESESKGKKKAFNFDKVNMDFNIDDDFGKIPSFNIDMPDLDISSPLKKDAKTKDKSNKELAAGNRKGKADHFAFSFDFDELDGFDFKSSPRKEDIKSKKDEEKENSSNRIGSHSGDHPAKESDGNGPHEDAISRMPTPEALIIETLHTQVDAGASPAIENLPSESIPDENILPNSKEASHVESHEAVTLIEKTITTKEKLSDCLLDKSNFLTPVSEEASIAIETIQDASVHTTSGEKSTLDTSSELQEEISSAATRHTASSEKDNGRSQVLDGEGTESALGESLPKKKGNLMNQNPLEVSTNPLSSMGQTMPSPKGGNMANRLMLEKEREAFVTRSKYFKQPDRSEDLSQNAPNQINFSSLSEKVIGGRHPCVTDESKTVNVTETQSDGKLTDISHSNPGAVVSKEHLKIGTQEHSEDLTLNRLLDKDVSKRKPASGGSFKNVKSLDSLRLTRQVDKSTLQNSAISGNLVPNMSTLQTKSNSTPEGDKSCSSKTTRKMPALSSLKILRTSGANLYSSKLIPQEEKSSKDSNKNRILVGSRHSETAQFVERKKQTPLISSLKRKMIETPKADAVLKPSKRLTESLSNRNSAQISIKIVDKETYNNENLVDGNSASALENSQNSNLDIPGELSMKELEVPFVFENDSNVEKAEAYTKELDDICNMLRKKHDEAKEILVRATVNNNKLLMLNHPLYEEKISFKPVVDFLSFCRHFVGISEVILSDFKKAYSLEWELSLMKSFLRLRMLNLSNVPGLISKCVFHPFQNLYPEDPAISAAKEGCSRMPLEDITILFYSISVPFVLSKPISHTTSIPIVSCTCLARRGICMNNPRQVARTSPDSIILGSTNTVALSPSFR